MSKIKSLTRYRCIVKADDKHFVKYYVSNLLTFTHMLDVRFPDWRYFNVFDKYTMKQIGNYTRYQRPRFRHI
jgi:hypothetical protein